MAARLNPYTNTREEFTTYAVAHPIPDNADPRWKNLAQTLKDLALKLLEHDAMRENKVQPFMTPAARKSRVYFLWDSTTRLLVDVFKVSPQLGAHGTPWSAKDREFWLVECVLKSKQIAKMALDSPGANPLTSMLNQFMAQGGETVDMGAEITQLAQRLLDLQY